MTVLENKQWQTVCSLEDLVAQSGVAALIEGKQIALFYLPDNDAVYAIDNYCPFAEANVLSRAIVGDLKGKTVIASPIYKQHFCLESGECLEDDTVKISVFETKIQDNLIQIAL
jgi:NAD(P)H-dependent nitrite reductase small subunit